MATQNDKLQFDQPANRLSEIADAERGKLFPKNDFSPKSEAYSPQHPDAMADGDEIGRGTSKFLDVYNTEAGTSTDIQERIGDVKINKFNSNKTYPNF